MNVTLGLWHMFGCLRNKRSYLSSPATFGGGIPKQNEIGMSRLVL